VEALKTLFTHIRLGNYVGIFENINF